MLASFLDLFLCLKIGHCLKLVHAARIPPGSVVVNKIPRIVLNLLESPKMANYSFNTKLFALSTDKW
jgi:hypothetical protein